MLPPTDLVSLTIDDFKPLLDETFALQAAGAEIALKLAEVEAKGRTDREGGAFSLLFVAPKGPWLPQAIYVLRHPAMGNMEIFLVPIGPLPGGNGYQAIFA